MGEFLHVNFRAFSNKINLNLISGKIRENEARDDHVFHYVP